MALNIAMERDSVNPTPTIDTEPNKKALLHEVLQAGVLGFEPRDAGVRVQCLTVWRYPNSYSVSWLVPTATNDILTYPSIFFKH